MPDVEARIRPGADRRNWLQPWGPAAGQDVLRSCIAVLADPYHRVHADIREILERHLDEDLATEAVLLNAFRGQLPDE